MGISSGSSAQQPAVQSPQHVRLSLAAAMTLGFVKGWFFRNARLGCINLLLTYPDGCKANCAFCGLARGNSTDRSFIRVPWRAYLLDEVIERIKDGPGHVSRVCVSMITHPRAPRDVVDVCGRVARETGKAVSLLISPTVMERDHLVAMRDAGADRIGVAIDAATPDLFERLRGRAVLGPHRWDKYWRVYGESIEVFGESMAGVHLICGLGETEREIVQAIDRAAALGGCTHLFSFFPEKRSAMEHCGAPPIGAYRRVQLARWLIDHHMGRCEQMRFDDMGRIADFGLPQHGLDPCIHAGSPFETSGCPGPDGKVACNRPFGNEKPGEAIRNFPFPPDAQDVCRICAQLGEF
ncbi:MAG: radical SAM protein [Thermodesulfobacteriota bacterium]